MSDDAEAASLRAAVLDELALVQGRIALAGKLHGSEAKEQLRLAHAVQRQARLGDAAEFLAAKEERLVKEFADGASIDAKLIEPVIIPVRTPAEADLFRFATLQWSVPVSSGYGRRSRFLVRDRQNGKLMAIFALGDPVIAQGARDEVVGWTTEQRMARLYNVYDAFILGAVEPYRQLLAGKLVALLALANETRDFLTRKYEGTVTMRGLEKDATPALITTSSALGRSSVYNRLTYRGDLMFRSVGYTKGFGHFQFSDELFEQLLRYARAQSEEGIKVLSSKYKSGPNWRFRVLRSALEMLGIPEESLQHNVKREVFLAPVARNWDSYLRGETDDLQPFDLPTEAIAEYYRERWAIGRAERRPAFRYWRHEEARISPLLKERPLQLTLGSRPLHGRVELGDFHLSVGVGRTTTEGVTVAGQESTGSAYLSRFESPGTEVTVADITWGNGEREVRGWARRGDATALDAVVGRLRMGIYPAERFRGMSMMELRLAAPTATSRVTARQTTQDDLSALLGFDVAVAFDKLADASLGTRETLLRDTGPRRRQLCVVFRSDDVVVPALAWTFTRALPLILDGSSEHRISPPDLMRPPPRPQDLGVGDGTATA